ncbi:MAG: SDR family oxidoreductase [Dehalococcoidia bacterium]
MPGRLEGKVAIVTGASSGIGRATAIAFAREGASVAVASRRAGETEETAAVIRREGALALTVPTDVSVEDQVHNLVEATVREFGRLDVAFNNAGVFGTEGPVHETSADLWDALIDTNLKGTWLCMKHEIPRMLEAGGGAIVNMASTAGVAGWSASPIYAASKFGIVGLTKSAALQYAPRGIRINAICPAFTRIERLDEAAGLDPEVARPLEATIPLGRIGTMEEVAEAVLWLASDAASFCAGHALVLDGGQTAGLW